MLKPTFKYCKNHLRFKVMSVDDLTPTCELDAKTTYLLKSDMRSQCNVLECWFCVRHWF